MKTTFFIIGFSIFLTSISFSQSIEKDTFRRSFGLDATFVNNFLPTQYEIGTQDDYLFHFIRYDKDDRLIRHSLDLDLYGNYQNNEISQDVDRTNINIAYKQSKGKRKKAADMFYVLYGSEVLLGYRLDREVDFEVITDAKIRIRSDQAIRLGIGNFVGLEFNFTDRLSLYTEARFYLNFEFGTNKVESIINTSGNYNNKEFTLFEKFDLPSTFILFYHF